jgi:protein TonB
MRGMITVLFLLFFAIVSYAKDDYVRFSRVNDDSIYDYVDVPPDFPGGADLLNAFISLNLVYPYKALEKKVEGKVILEFVVKADGTLSDIKVIKGIGFGCDEEAVRVFQMMPPWEPAQCEGKNVATKVVYPVIFKIPN